MEVHEFWSTQPVPQPGEEKEALIAGPVDRPKTVEEIPVDGIPIASTLEWWTPDLTEATNIHAIYELLHDNYVEDKESLFRFKYSEDFLRFALMPPGYDPNWHVAIRRKSDKALLGFVSGIPMMLRMGTPQRVRAGRSAEEAEKHTDDHLEARRICEINFLCVKKTLREKRMAPILIQEVTRRVNRTNVWQAVYTAGKLLPTPFARAQYYHRNLNPEKLVSVGFSVIPASLQKFQNPMSILKRLCQLPSEPKTRGLRPMLPKDVPQVGELLRRKLEAYDVAPVFSDEEVAHYVLPREGVIMSYVVEREKGEEDGKRENGKYVTDFFSYYSIPSTIIGNSKFSTLNAAYVHYYAINSVPVVQLMGDLLVMALKDGFDVCNMVDILENEKIVEPLKFGLGDGSLYYYFYNWAYPKLSAKEIGLVML